MVKGTEVGGERVYDGGKKLWGLKRHIITDVLGLLLKVLVSAASADDGTFAPHVLSQLTTEHRSRLEVIWADGKYYNHHLDEWLTRTGAGYQIEAIGRPPGAVGFVKLPRRWVVERTFVWLGRYRRNSRDYELYPETSESIIKISSIHRMLRLLSPDQCKEPIPFMYRETHGIASTSSCTGSLTRSYRSRSSRDDLAPGACFLARLAIGL